MKTQNHYTNILLLSANAYLSLYVVRALDQRKYRIFVMGLEKQCVMVSKFCKRYFICEKTDEKFVRQIHEICELHDISVIVPLDLSFGVGIAAIKHMLHCPVFPVGGIDMLMMLSNKWKLTSLLQSLRIPYPKTILVMSEDELSDTILPKPFLLKPLMQAGGRGITKIAGAADIDLYKRSFSPYKTFPLLAQEFIPGDNVDLSLLANDGMIVGSTIQTWHKDGSLEFIDDPSVLIMGKKIVHHVRYSGLMHIDLRRDERTGEVLLLECNPRSWGSIGASILAGVDFIQLGARCAQRKSVLAAPPQKTTYDRPLQLLKTLLTRPWTFSTFSPISKRDFINTVSDPLPYIALFFGLIAEYVINRFTLTEGLRQRLKTKALLSVLSPVPPLTKHTFPKEPQNNRIVHRPFRSPRRRVRYE